MAADQIFRHFLSLNLLFEACLAQRKMNGNKLKPKSPNLNPFLCQPDPIELVLGSWGPTRPVWTQKLGPKLDWTQKKRVGFGHTSLAYLTCSIYNISSVNINKQD